MTSVRQYLKARRKAELQAIHQFWFPGEAMLTTREELEHRVAEALTGGLEIDEKVARLSRSQRSLLTLLLNRKNYTEESNEVRRALESQGTPTFEVENSTRMLKERGFIDRHRGTGGGRGREVVVIPRELGKRLGDVLDAHSTHVAPEHQLSQHRLPFDIDFEGQGIDERVDQIEDPVLAQLVRVAVEHRGLADKRTPGVQSLIEKKGGGGDPGSLYRPEWRTTLEEAGIGTIGPVSLKDFGIQVEEPALIIFQEWIQQRSRNQLYRLEEPDTLLEAGVDLCIDIDHLATRLETFPISLTRGGRIPKRVYDSLRDILYLPRLESHLEGDLVETSVNLSLSLGIIETYGDELRVHPDRFRVWRKLDLVRQVDILLGRFQSDHRGERWSFHQEALRQILIEFLKDEQPTSWVSLDALVATAVSTYLLELEERDVRGILRQRREEDFSKERLNSTFHRLGTDLVYWIVNRFLLLGVCELGFSDGRLSSFRLTALGQALFGIEQESGENRILVNPDFEIILFCEGLDGMRLELSLSRFGERISAERIRRYRVTGDTVREGIQSGLSLAEIREVLDQWSDHRLPDAVGVLLKEWGKDLDWVDVQPAVILRGLQPKRAKSLSETLAEEDCRHQLYRDGSIVIGGEDLDGDSISGVLERLRERGWLIRTSPEIKPWWVRAEDQLEHREA